MLWTVESSMQRELLDQGKCVKDSRSVTQDQSGYHYRQSTLQASLEGYDGTGHQTLL